MMEKLSNEREPLQQRPSQEIINDPKVLWHAVRGYDFAGLESMLGEGLMPSEDQDYCVCFSTSPARAWLANREANSFYTYTLNDGISLAVVYSGLLRGVHGGFMDELRIPDYIDSGRISGLMLPEGALDRPLVEISTQHGARKPQQAEKYINRTICHLQELGVEIDEANQACLREAVKACRNGQYLSTGQNDTIQKIFMNHYSQSLQQLGLEPIVGEMIQLVFERAGKSVDVYGWTEEQKRWIGQRNDQEAFAARKRVAACNAGAYVCKKLIRPSYIVL
jgi:hypothetical protein